MVRSFVALLKKELSGLHEAAFLLAFFAFFSQILAVVRDRLLAHSFGAGSELDIYYTAFRIPDFIYISIASLASITVLIPFLSEYLKDESISSKDRAGHFLNSVLTTFTALIGLVSIGAWFFMPQLTPFIAPGFSEGARESLVQLSRILLLSPILLGLSNLFGSITQLFRRFFVYALSPILYNIGIIIGIVWFYPIFGLSGLAYGVVLGAIFHMALQLWSLWGGALHPRFVSTVDFGIIRRVVVLSLPRTFALSASHITMLVLVALATLMPDGSVSVFNFAFNLQSVPLSLIGVSYSLAAFPVLASLFTNGDKKAFVEKILTALKHIIFWLLPATIFFIVLRAHIVRVFLGSGDFSWADTRLTAAALALFVISIFAQGATLLLVRGFYAAGETRIPLWGAVVSSIITVISAFLLTNIFVSQEIFRYFIESLLRVEEIPGTILLMLPLAFTLGSIVNTVWLWVFFVKKYDSIVEFGVIRSFFQNFSAGIIAGVVTYAFLYLLEDSFNQDTFIGIFSQGFIAGIFGIITWVGVLFILGNIEIREVWFTLRQKFWKSDVVAEGMTEL